MEFLRSKIQSVTVPLHQRMEASQFHQSLLKQSLPKLSLVSYLHCLSIIQASLESCLEKSIDPRVKKVWYNQSRKLNLLQADLELIQTEKINPIGLALTEALKLAAQIIKSSRCSVSLLGYLYVFEGSQNGGLILRQLISQVLNVAPEKLSYFGCYGKSTSAVWSAFVENLNAISVDSDEEQKIVRAARESFEALDKILQALDPNLNEENGLHIRAINAEAGNHALPSNPLEIEIALRAGIYAWERFPYLRARYHERGERFTTSDSCWLITLIPQSYTAIDKSISWLRTVLASRGLPTIILETHLHEILLEYEKRFPSKATLINNLRQVANDLKNKREEYFDLDAVRALKAKYAERLHALDKHNLGDVIELLISAKADEMSGIKSAFSSVATWLTDGVRFAPTWINLVSELIAEIENRIVVHD